MIPFVPPTGRNDRDKYTLLIAEFKKESGYKGSFWHMGVVKEYTKWLMDMVTDDKAR